MSRDIIILHISWVDAEGRGRNRSEKLAMMAHHMQAGFWILAGFFFFRPDQKQEILFSSIQHKTIYFFTSIRRAKRAETFCNFFPHYNLFNEHFFLSVYEQLFFQTGS